MSDSAQEEKIIPERWKLAHKSSLSRDPVSEGGMYLWPNSTITKLIEELGAAEAALSSRSDEMERMRKALEEAENLLKSYRRNGRHISCRERFIPSPVFTDSTTPVDTRCEICKEYDSRAALAPQEKGGQG